MGRQHDVVQTVAHQYPVDVQQTQQLRRTEQAKFAHWMERLARFADHRSPTQAFDPCGQSVGVFAQEVHGMQNCSIAWRGGNKCSSCCKYRHHRAQDIASSSAPGPQTLPQTTEATSNHISDNPRQLFFPVDVQPRQNGLELPPRPTSPSMAISSPRARRPRHCRNSAAGVARIRTLGSASATTIT